ncbi:MAG TPA: winged helix-turn-helix domain-containing protein [Thermoanaerobaculia bacterium]|nr:winged helix-turn-helix domain-containing protein [Thermoanaerobaculia bacterium]
MPATDSSLDVCYSFGPYLLNPQQATLFRGSEPVPLTPKVFDTLVVLVENAGRVLTRQALMEQVWPDTVVVDSSLSQNIWLLRTTLGEDEQTKYIETVPRRGYRFVGVVTKIDPSAEPPRPPAPVAVEEQAVPQRVAASIPPPSDEPYSEEFVVVRRRRSARRRTNAFFAAILALSVITTAVVVWRFGLREPAARHGTVLAAERLPIEERVSEIAISPDGRQLAYVARDSQDRASLFLRKRDAENAVVLESAIADVRRLSFSGDGGDLHYQRLASGQETHYALHSYSLSTGRGREIVAGIFTAAIAPKSGSVLYVPESTTEQRVMLRDRAARSDRAILNLPLPQHLLGRMAWSPDERQVAVTHYHAGWYVSVIDPRAGTIRHVAGPWHTIRGFAWMPDGKRILASAGSDGSESSLWRVDTVSGSADRVTTPLHAMGSISASADGRTLATVEPSVTGRVITFSVSDTAARAEVLPAVKGGSSPRWCAGGFVAEREIGGSPDLWLLDERGKPLRQLTATPDREAEVAVSPDGKRIAYTIFSPEGRSSISMLSLENGVAVHLTADAHARRPAFSHDGNSIIYSETTNWWRSMIVSTETRKPTPLLNGITSLAKESPDGRHLVAASWTRLADWPSYVVTRTADRQLMHKFWLQDAEQFQWMDDQTLTYVKPTGAEWVLYAVPMTGGTARAIATFDSRVESYDYNRATGKFLVATTVPSSHAYVLRIEP